VSESTFSANSARVPNLRCSALAALVPYRAHRALQISRLFDVVFTDCLSLVSGSSWQSCQCDPCSGVRETQTASPCLVSAQELATVIVLIFAIALFPPLRSLAFSTSGRMGRMISLPRKASRTVIKIDVQLLWVDRDCKARSPTKMA
jgi:hypothetical protein